MAENDGYTPLVNDTILLKEVLSSEVTLDNILKISLICIFNAPNCGCEGAAANCLSTTTANYTTRESVVITQPQMYARSNTAMAVVNDNRAGHKNSWSSTLCGCCEDIPGCCLAMCFWNCYLGCVSKRMGEHCCIGCFLSGLWPMRAAFRERHNIEGTMCNDACTVFWCAPCVACQLDREMTKLNYEKRCCC